MEAVRADDQIEAAFPAALQCHVYSGRVFFQLDDTIVKNDLAIAPYLLEDQPGKIASPDGHEAATRKFRKDSRAESRHARVIAVDDP